MKKTIVVVMCALLLALGLEAAQGAEKFEQKTYTVEEAVTEMEINARDREIQVVASEDDQIHLVYYENDQEYYEITTAEDGKLTMQWIANKSWMDYIGGKAPEHARKIILQLPDTGLKSLTLSTTNEDISLEPVVVTEALTLDVNGGSLYLEEAYPAQRIAINVKNGDISGTIQAGYDDYHIVTSIKKGTCNLPQEKTGGEKELTVQCNHGDVALNLPGK